MKVTISHCSENVKGDITEQVSRLNAMQPQSGNQIFTTTALSTALGALIGYVLDKVLFKSSQGPVSAAIDMAAIAGVVSFFNSQHNNRKIKDIQHELDAKFGKTPER